jgi:thiamine diphosphokinase
MKGIVVSGGEINLHLLKSIINEYSDAAIISVDAAVTSLLKLNIIPNVMVGDFDTLDNESLVTAYEKQGVKIIRHNPIKDYSDSELAMEYAYEEGIKEVIMLGALGRRFDHAFSNVNMLLKYKKMGMNIIIYDEHNKIYVKSSSFKLSRKHLWGKYISFFSIENKALMESLSGVAYRVKNKPVDNVGTPSLFISNEIVDEYMDAIFQGDLLVVESRD